MKTKSWLMLLSLWGASECAMAQYAAPDAAPPAPAASVAVPEVAEMPAQDRVARPDARPRQGADMRHCLDRKTLKAIIRCAEPGRKP